MNLDELAALIENSPDFEWVRHAACGNLELGELDRFFVEAGRSLSADTVLMCKRCPVRVECLDHAYRHDISGGYFGGLSPSKRKAVSHSEARQMIAPADGGPADVAPSESQPAVLQHGG